MPEGRPGTTCKEFIEKWFGGSSGGCSCSDIAADMDRLGVEGCEKHFKELQHRMFKSALQWKKDTGSMLPINKIFVRTLLRKCINWSKPGGYRDEGPEDMFPNQDEYVVK